MKYTYGHSTPEILRQKAEDILNTSASPSIPPRNVSQLSEADMRKLIQELDVHQVELELQNEELRLSKKQEESERYARGTLDALSEGIAILDDTGIILSVNRVWRELANDEAPVPANVCEGANYLEVCDAAYGPDILYSKAIAAGIRAIIQGEQSFFRPNIHATSFWIPMSKNDGSMCG